MLLHVKCYHNSHRSTFLAICSFPLWGPLTVIILLQIRFSCYIFLQDSIKLAPLLFDSLFETPFLSSKLEDFVHCSVLCSQLNFVMAFAKIWAGLSCSKPDPIYLLL